MLSFALRTLSNLLYIASFLLIVFSFFRPTLREISFRGLYGSLLLLFSTVVSCFIHSEELNMLSDTLLLLGFLLLYCGESFRRILKYYVFTVIFLGLADTISLMLLGAFTGQSYMSILLTPGGSTGSLMLMGSTLLMLILFCNWGIRTFPKGLEELTVPEFLQYVAALAVDLVIVLWILWLKHDTSDGFSWSWFFMHLTVALGIYLQLFFLFKTLVLGHVYIEKTAITEKYLEAQKFHYEYLEKRERDTKKFRHDLRGHLLVLGDMAKRGEKEALTDYILAITERFQNNTAAIQTSNGIADAIVNQYDAEAARRGLVFTVRGQFPAECEISSMDLCTILSNLLSNALEGLEKGKGRLLELDIRHDDERIYLNVINDCNPKLQLHWSSAKRKTLFLPTTKGNASNHGFGLENVEECVRMNKGFMQITAENGRFEVLIELKNRKREEV